MRDQDELLKKRSIDDIEEKGFVEKEEITERRKDYRKKGEKMKSKIRLGDYGD